jgi:hypothetical protein
VPQGRFAGNAIRQQGWTQVGIDAQSLRAAWAFFITNPLGSAKLKLNER